VINSPTDLPHQEKFTFNEWHDILQGPFFTLPAFTEYHAVIRIPNKSMTSAG